MGINFPSSPTAGQLFAPSNAGPLYVYSGGAWRRNAGTALPTNKIVNPAMQISQENGNTALTVSSRYAADTWITAVQLTGFTFSFQRVQVATPKGSLNRLRITVSGSGVLPSNNLMIWVTYIEGNRCADLQWGAATGKSAVLRFGWKSPAGVYSVALFNNTSDRTFVANFTISAGQANTDTEQVIVIPPELGGGVWRTDNGIGVAIYFCMVSGSAYAGVPGWQVGNFYGTSANTNVLSNGQVFEFFDVGFYADPNNTGVAPEFQAPHIEDDLQDCLRYWYKAKALRGVCTSATNVRVEMHHPVIMRAIPSLAALLTGATLRIYDASNAPTVTSITANNVTSQHIDVTVTASAGAMTVGRPGNVLVDGSVANNELVGIACNARL